jgi:hypothetical protein
VNVCRQSILQSSFVFRSNLAKSARPSGSSGRKIKVGDKLYLYTGMRTKHARRLRVERCEAVIPLWIERDGSIFLDKRQLDGKESDKMARADGFQTVDDFVSWFRDHYGLPFYGILIRW